MKNGVKKGFLLVKIDFAFLPTTFIVYRVLVHCRVGSLENSVESISFLNPVHCRVGSLEIQSANATYFLDVHCRVGSLENWFYKSHRGGSVHCRVGSLEIF